MILRHSKQQQNNQHPISPSFIMLKLSIHFRTEYGLALYLIGNTTNTGSWDPSRALRLSWNQADIWSIEVPVEDFEYKYFIGVFDHPQVLEWEAGPNRQFMSCVSADIFDVWNHRLVQFECVNYHAVPVFIQGSCHELGCFHKRIQMKNHNGLSTYRISVNVLEDQIIYYQYVIKTKKEYSSSIQVLKLKAQNHYSETTLIVNFGGLSQMRKQIYQFDKGICYGYVPREKADFKKLQQAGLTTIVEFTFENQTNQREGFIYLTVNLNTLKDNIYTRLYQFMQVVLHSHKVFKYYQVGDIYLQQFPFSFEEVSGSVFEVLSQAVELIMQQNNLYYLQNKDSSIRSQLMPVPVEVDHYFEELFHYFRKNLNKVSQGQIEIEVKLGSFISKDQAFKQMLDNFRFVSRHHHIFLQSFAQFYTFHPNFCLYPWNELPFDTSNFPPSLQNLLYYFRRMNKNQDEILKGIQKMYIDSCMSSIRQGVRLDINFQSGERASIYDNGDRMMIKKERGDSLDIMKDRLQFRITTQVEFEQQANDLDDRLQSQPIRSIRFKSFMQFQFQFFQVDISRVMYVPVSEFYSLQNLGTKQMLKQMLINLHDVEPEGPVPREEYIQKSNRKTEIEFEIIDIEYVKLNLEPSIRRILRNVDAFFYTDKVQYDILFEKITKIHPHASRNAFQPPIIGQYLQQSYNQAAKNL